MRTPQDGGRRAVGAPMSQKSYRRGKPRAGCALTIHADHERKVERMKPSTKTGPLARLTLAALCTGVASAPLAQTGFPTTSTQVTHTILIPGTSSTSRGFGVCSLEEAGGSITLTCGVVDRVFSSGTTTLTLYQGWYGEAQAGVPGTPVTGGSVTCQAPRICQVQLTLDATAAQKLNAGQIYAEWENGGTAFQGQVLPKDYDAGRMTNNGVSNDGYLTLWKVDETTLGYYVHVDPPITPDSVYLYDASSGTSPLGGVPAVCDPCTQTPLTGTIDIGASMSVWDNGDLGFYIDGAGGSLSYVADYVVEFAGYDFQSGPEGIAVHASLDDDDWIMNVRMTYYGSLFGITILDVDGNNIAGVGGFDTSIPLSTAEQTQLLNDELVYVVVSSPSDFEAPLLNLQTADISPPGPEITVLGTGDTEIADGSTTPSTGDGTDFGNVAVGSSGGPTTFTIANDGGADLSVSSIGLSGADADRFTLGGLPSLPATVASSGQETFTIGFTPADAAGYSATVTIGNDDADEDPYTFDIAGTGTGAPQLAVANSIDFGDVAVGASADETLTLENTGNLPLTLNSFSLPSTTFGYSGAPRSIAAGGSAGLTLTFTPAAGGADSASLSISSNDAGSPESVSLIGFGTTAATSRRQTLTGTPGTAERFVYTAASQQGGTINGFTPNEDVLVLTELLAAIGYSGADPFDDGIIRFRERRGSTRVLIDPDGTGPRRAFTLTMLQGVAQSSLDTGRDVEVGALSVP